MKAKIKGNAAATAKASLLSAVLLFGGATLALAQNLPTTINVAPNAGGASQAQALSEEQIQAQLRQMGFSNIRDERLSGNVYEATADWQGRNVDFTIDLRNGGIKYDQATAAAPGAGTTTMAVADRPTVIGALPADATADDVKDALEELDFTDVHNVRESDGVYHATANWHGSPVNVAVAVDSGAITYSTVAAATPARRVVLPEGAAIPTISGGDEMNPDYVREQLEAIGFTDIQDIKESGEVFETAARLNGEWVQLTVRSDDGGITIE